MSSNYFSNYHKLKSISYNAIINPFASCSYLQYMTLPPSRDIFFKTWSYKYSIDIYENFKYINDGVDPSKFVYVIY